MIKKHVIFRILVVVGIILVFLCNLFPVYAISSNPTTLQMNSINAYQNCLVLGDMGFAVDYTIVYTVLPTETVTSTYNVRMMDGTTQLQSVAPFSFFQHGFNRGVVWLYFDPAQVIALGLTWSGTYTMRLDGNPTASWSGSVPSAPSRTDFIWNTSATVAQTSLIFTNYILVEAQALTTVWNSSSYVLYTISAQNGTKLTTTGETYFLNIIPNLRLIAPNAFLTTQLPLNMITNPATPLAYANSIGSDFQGVSYTTGTVTFNNGSPNVVGAGTTWTSAMNNGQIKGNADSIWYTIQSVTSPTTMILTSNYNATGGIGLGYTLIYSTVPNSTIAPADPLTLDPVSDALAIPKAVLGTVLCLVVIIIVMIKGAQHANSYKPLIIIVIPILYLFTRIGWMPMALTIGLGILSAFAIVYVIFWEKTSY